nr:hypothetical protein BACY1_20720 [Tenacibaculum mesophilum]
MGTKKHIDRSDSSSQKRLSKNEHSEINKSTRFKKVKNCLHTKTSLVVIDGFASWELTAEKCSKCNNILQKTITNY